MAVSIPLVSSDRSGLPDLSTPAAVALGAAGAGALVVGGLLARGAVMRHMYAKVPAGAPSQATLDSLRGLGMLDASGEVQMLRARRVAEIDAITATLEHGKIIEGSRKPLGKAGIHGQMYQVQLERAGGAPLRAVEQPAGTMDLFAWRLARAMGIEYMFPVVAKRAGGEAGLMMSEMVPGKTFIDLDVRNADQIDEIIRGYYAAHFPKLTPEQVDKAARIDRQLFQAFDEITANYDRHGGNGLADLEKHLVNFIDNDALSAGENIFNVARPSMRTPYLRGADASRGRVPLDPETVEVLRQRLTPDVIRDVHKTLKVPPPKAHGFSIQGLLDARLAKKAAKDSYARGMVARRNRIVSHGEVTYDRFNVRRWVGDNILGPVLNVPMPPAAYR